MRLMQRIEHDVLFISWKTNLFNETRQQSKRYRWSSYILIKYVEITGNRSKIYRGKNVRYHVIASR